MPAKKNPVEKNVKVKAVTPAKDPVFLTEYDRYLFGEGRNYKIYQKMGAHKAQVNGKEGMHFAVWAPHAARVTVASESTNWNPEVNELQPQGTSGIFEGFVEGMGYGELYKYVIHTSDGRQLFKADPYAFSSELRPGNASKTASITDHQWKDSKWLKARAEANTFESPMSPGCKFIKLVCGRPRDVVKFAVEHPGCVSNAFQ